MTDHWPEDREGHPVDPSDTAVIPDAALHTEFADIADDLRAAGTSVLAPGGPEWVVPLAALPDLDDARRARLREFDVYDGGTTPEQYGRVLLERWRRHGRRTDAAATGAVQIWECVLLQNPACVFVARYDRAGVELEQHVHALVDAVSGHRPLLVYLDPGDPASVLERAAAERPTEWLDTVIEYHTAQGYGRNHGLTGFDGYVEFMRHRREIEVSLLPRLALPTLHLQVGDDDPAERAARVQEFIAAHASGAL